MLTGAQNSKSKARNDNISEVSSQSASLEGGDAKQEAEDV